MSASKPAKPATTDLRAKVGGSAGALITEQVRRQAHANLQTLSASARETLTERVGAMMDCMAEHPADVSLQLFRHAHDIRGVAGTFGLTALGEIADAICLYLDDLLPNRLANRTLLETLVRALHLALTSHDHIQLERASAECRAAVRLLRTREGRTPELS